MKFEKYFTESRFRMVLLNVFVRDEYYELITPSALFQKLKENFDFVGSDDDFKLYTLNRLSEVAFVSLDYFGIKTDLEFIQQLDHYNLIIIESYGYEEK